MPRVPKKRVRYGRHGFLFVLPFLLAFTAFQLIPVLNTAYLSLTNMKGNGLDSQFVGLTNFFRSSQSIILTGLAPERAAILTKALQDSGIDFYSDLPDTGNTAKVDPYASLPTNPADQNPDPSIKYLIKLTKLDAAGLAAAQAVLSRNGASQMEIDSATGTVHAGLVFDKVFWFSFGNTLLLFAMSFLPQFCFALVFAVWLTDISLKIRLGGWFKTIFYMPNIIMTSSIVVFFALMFDSPAGPVNVLLTKVIGLPDPVNFFRNELWTRGIVAFIQFWMFFGTTLILLSAGVLGIPLTLVESAMIDGAKPRQVFWHVTLPLLRPIILYTLVTSLISGLQLFDIPFLLTGGYGGVNGSATTTAMYMYNLAFSSANNYSYGATISMGMFVLMLALAGVMFRILSDRDNFFRKGAGK